jgi:TP901 family phage tail tape measure protein
MELFKLFGRIFVDNDSANESIDQTDKKASSLSKVFGGLGGAAVTAGKFIGGALLAGAGIAVGGLGAMVLAGDDLQKALNGLQSSTGSTKEEMEGMEQSLKNIYGNNFGESFDDIAQAMALVKQNTGLTGKELETTTQNALMLRDTFELDVAGSTNAANTMMKQFGISSEEAFNLIAQGAQNGANKNGDLIDSLNEYSPQFKAMGFSAEDFTNVLIDGAKNGAFSIDKVGDAIKEFNIRSKDGSKTSADAFKSLGFNAGEMTKSFGKGGESAQKSFGQVMTALNKVKDPVEKNRIGVELFGTQFEDLEAKGIASLANIGNKASLSKDALGEINKVKYNSFGEALTGIGRQITTGLILPLSEKIMPKLNEFAQWVTDHMPQIKAGIDKAIGEGAKVFDKLKSAVGFVIDNFNIIGPIIAGVTATLIAQLIINTLVGLYDKWKAATAAQTTMQWLLNAAMNANPIGLVALAIGALIAIGLLLWKNWDSVSKWLAASWAWIKQMAITVWGGITAYFNFVLNFYKTIFTAVWNVIKAVVVGIWNGIKVAAKFVWDGIKSYFTNVLNFYKSIFTTVWNGIKSFLTIVWNGIKSTAATVWNGIKSTISGVVNGIKSTVTSVWNGLKSVTSSVWNGIKSAIMNPINAAVNTVKTAIGKIKGFFSGLSLKLPNIKTPHFKLKNWSKNPLDWVKNMPSVGIDWYAKGTNYADGGLSVVGEHGPELLNLPRGSQVKNASETRSMMKSDEMSALVRAIEKLASRDFVVNMDGREFIRARASDIFDALETLGIRKDRGAGLV